MQVGYFAVGLGRTVDPEWVRTVATPAERLGFSTIWAPEHVVLLEQYASKYPYSSGDFPAPPDTAIADPFTTLAYAAACTTRIRLATGICLVPEHNPLVLASRPGRYHLGDGSLQHLQALARQTDASHLLAAGYRQMPALLLLLHRRRIGPDLFARADMVSVPPPVLLQRA